MKTYSLKPSIYITLPWYCNDLDREQKKALKSHVSAQDYFGTLATVLSLMTQGKENNFDREMADELVDELTFLQDNFKIYEK